jgi:hypothetical protein
VSLCVFVRRFNQDKGAYSAAVLFKPPAALDAAVLRCAACLDADAAAPKTRDVTRTRSRCELPQTPPQTAASAANDAPTAEQTDGNERAACIHALAKRRTRELHRNVHRCHYATADAAVPPPLGQLHAMAARLRRHQRHHQTRQLPQQQGDWRAWWVSI